MSRLVTLLLFATLCTACGPSLALPGEDDYPLTYYYPPTDERMGPFAYGTFLVAYPDRVKVLAYEEGYPWFELPYATHRHDPAADSLTPLLTFYADHLMVENVLTAEPRRFLPAPPTPPHLTDDERIEWLLERERERFAPRPGSGPLEMEDSIVMMRGG